MKAAALLLCLVLTSCGTIVPDAVAPGSASYDGNEQTSGILAANANGYVVTDHFRDRYNSLVATYGRDFTVAIKTDDGLQQITGKTWLIDRQHLGQFLEMQAWARAKVPPHSPLPQ